MLDTVRLNVRGLAILRLTACCAVRGMYLIAAVETLEVDMSLGCPPARSLALALLTVGLVLAQHATTGANERAASWAPDVAAARSYAKHRRGRISFDIIDARGRERGLRPARTFPMASVFKVMLLATYLRQPSVAHRRLHHSERKLLVPMIRRSDSAAATRVRDIVGPGAIGRLARIAGMHRFHYNPV
jgi:hypothetical protein